MRTSGGALPPHVANTRRHGRVPAVRTFAACALLAIAIATFAQPVPTTTPPAGTKRPKIGLVLSGGGARGITHIGVLKVLEEAHIPVDYIAATSMGSIVGGLYAMGMSPRDMDHIITTVDWTTLFSDSPPRRELSFREKEINRRFPLPLEVGIRGTEIRGFQGVLSGANLTLFLHELSIGADGVKELDRLPIPFRCVATDMVTGEPFVFETGPLYVAMRSSMSIPGVFSPSEVDGRILGDGGLVDNLPVDVVRRMGADIVIAVNIGTPLATRDQLSSIIGLTSQMINILTEQNVRKQLASLGPSDVLIAPDLGVLSASEFAKSTDFIRLGEEAARAALPELSALALPAAEFAAYRAALPRLVAPVAPPPLEFVRIEGTQHANPAVIEARLAIPLGRPLDVADVNSRVSRLYGSGDFDSITYHVTEEDEKSGIVFDVRERSIGPNYLRFGLTYSTDFQGETAFSLLAGLKRTWVNSLGAQILAELEVGRIFRASGQFYQPLDALETYFVTAQGSAAEPAALRLLGYGPRGRVCGSRPTAPASISASPSAMGASSGSGRSTRTTRGRRRSRCRASLRSGRPMPAVASLPAGTTSTTPSSRAAASTRISTFSTARGRSRSAPTPPR